MINIEDGVPAGVIRILLHHYVSPSPFPEPERSSPFYRETIAWMKVYELTTDEPDDDMVLTLRGKAWVDMIRSTPLPVQVWCDPRAKA